jgi:hypothetical protein
MESPEAQSPPVASEQDFLQREGILARAGGYKTITHANRAFYFLPNITR